MKKELLSFKIPQVKQRAHRALFDRELPFQPRVEKPKTQFNRRPKHRNNLGAWEQ